MVDCDLLHTPPVGLLAVFRGQDAVFSEDSVFAADATLFDQTENRGGGDGLTHAGDTKQMGWRQFFTRIPASHSERLLIRKTTILSNSDGKTRRRATTGNTLKCSSPIHRLLRTRQTGKRQRRLVIERTPR